MAVYNLFDLQAICLRSYFLPTVIFFKYGFLGVILYHIALLIFQYALRQIFGWHAITMLDEFFLLDNEKNRSNIITVIKLDKIKNYEEFRSFVIARCTQHPRTRHRLVKYMGWFFFEELPFDEVE